MLFSENLDNKDITAVAQHLHLHKQIKQTAMKTSTKIKITIITTLIILTNVSFGQNNNDTKETTMTITTESKSYLV